MSKRRVSFNIPEEQDEEKEEQKCERTVQLPGTVVNIEDAAARSESGSDEVEVASSNSDDEKEKEDAEDKEQCSDSAPTTISSFGEMVLDARVERAIERLGWRRPTPAQSAAIPSALSGRDILVCAPTGSGKTGAFAIPIAQYLCNCDSSKVGVRAVILVPTRELIQQVTTVMKNLCRYIDGIRVSSVFGSKKISDVSSKRRKVTADKATSMFDRSADILVGTPSSIAELCTHDDGKLLDNVGVVVIDEADLVLSYGYEKDARKALVKVPTSAQAMLLSATLDSEEVEGLGKIALRSPLVINISNETNEEEGDGGSVTAHYYAKLKNPKDRFLVAYAMLRLNVLAGKVLVFVNHVNAGFRLKLFLDQFKIKSAVLNSQLPLNSRIHCVEQFNAGIFQVLIACDEIELEQGSMKNATESNDGEKTKPKSKRRRKQARDDEFGLSRGFDFRSVAAVMNFDFPADVSSYTHRAGRTGRAGASGTVLTLAVTEKEERNIVRMGRELGASIGPLAFRMEQIEAFRYRVEDCLRMVTDAAVNSARLADIHREMVNSEKLREYFDENPQDFDALKHDLVLTRNIPSHLAHIPSYLLPPALRESLSQEADGSRLKIRNRRPKDKMRNKNKKKKKSNSKSKDPLSSLSARNSNSRSRKRGVKDI